ISLPNLQVMGLGNIPSLVPNGLEIQGIDPVTEPTASYGAMLEVSQGKDTTTGHWEIAGLVLKEGFQVFHKDYPSFPDELIQAFSVSTGRDVMCNRSASGTAVIAEFGEQQMKNGAWIVYTSADSVFQIAAHEHVIPLNELYAACKIARELCNSYRIGRVIARPFLGKPGAFIRTENRRDYSYPLPGPTILDKLSSAGFEVITVGKLDDIFDGKGITTSNHVENNQDAQRIVLQLARSNFNGLVFANLIDFDMLYGHRRDPRGYADALVAADCFLGELNNLMRDNDILIITADHGNDPTFKGTDHTREIVPLLLLSPAVKGHSLGLRNGFYDIAQSLAKFFGVGEMDNGVSFIKIPLAAMRGSAISRKSDH
ncbi:MAG: phosphopentomutase, partial [Lentisphaerae bacterium]|nr:phosphopentomutase [Lentisphaerota bacterium]